MQTEQSGERYKIKNRAYILKFAQRDGLLAGGPTPAVLRRFSFFKITWM